SSERPEKYPFEVLWNIADCQDDDDACPTKSNPSRPPMHKAIRHTDGTLLTLAEYNHIQSSARQLTAGLLMLPLPKNWLKAIHELERRHPVVALCSGHWKAEHILGALLLSKRSSSKRRSHGRDNLSESDDNGAISADDMAMTPTTSNNTTLSSGADGGLTATSELPSDFRSGAATTSATSFSPPQLVLSTNASSKRALPSPQSEQVDVSFIKINPSPDNLLGKHSIDLILCTIYIFAIAILSHDFPTMNNGIELLGAMKLAPNFSTGSTPSNSMITFIERIENADPNSDNTDEDDMDISWGHRQFTAGSMTCATTLTSWASIRDVATACRLIAAAIKTCRVARHICFAKKVETSSYLSDAYLENTLDLLWVHWKTAG
ncbi:hypothetical protein B0H21DRAFT_674938, partial [Amylocystis lapponica]